MQVFVTTGIVRADATWVGAAGTWGDAANWSGAPTPPDGVSANFVFIGNNGTVSMGGGSFSANGLRVGHAGASNAGSGELNVDSGYLYDSDDSYIGDGNAGTLNVNGGHLVIENTEHLYLGGGPEGFAPGTVNVSSGTLEFQSKYGIETFTGATSSTVNMSGGLMWFNLENTNWILVNQFNFSGGEIRNVRTIAIHSLTGNGTMTFQQNSTATATLSLATDMTFDGAIFGSTTSNRGRVVKEGAGQLTLTGQRGQFTHQDGLVINGGSIKTTASNVLSLNSAVTLADIAGVFLDLNGTNQTVRAISGGGSVGGNILLGGGTITTNSSTLSTYAGVISGTGGLDKQGSGTLVFTGANSYSGGTRITTGVIQIGPGGSIGTGDVLDNASLEVFGNTTIGALKGSGSATVATPLAQFRSIELSSTLAINSGTASIIPNGTNTGASRVNVLSIAGGPATPTATLDLNDNDLIVRASSVSDVTSLVFNGRNFGGWDQPGITSSAARTQATQSTTLGVMSGADYESLYGAGADFSGFAVAATDTLVKYTWYGDTDFTGAVDFDDYVRTDGGFNSGLTGWLNGDFDLSGVVDFDDYVLIDLGFNTQSGTLRRAMDYIDGSDRTLEGMDALALQKVVEHFAQFGTDYGTHFLSAVPEPASVGLMTLGVATAFARRRRR